MGCVRSLCVPCFPFALGQAPLVREPDSSHVLLSLPRSVETAGQSCIVGSRILVHESIHDAFVKLLVARVAEMSVGKNEDAFYGSLISKAQFDKVLGFIETGKSEGAKVEIGGESPSFALLAFAMTLTPPCARPLAGESFAPEGHVNGFFVKPTVFSNVSPTSTVGRDEVRPSPPKPPSAPAS